MDVHEKINMRGFRQVLEFPDKLEAAQYFAELKADKKLQIITVSYDGESWLIKAFGEAFLAALPNEHYFALRSREAADFANKKARADYLDGNKTEKQYKAIID